MDGQGSEDDVAGDGGAHRRRRRARRAGVAAAVVLGLVVPLGAQQVYCDLTFDTGLLCERADGSRWRDPSFGCSAGEDPRCEDGRGCTDSTKVPEGPRESCGWLRQREWPAT